MEKILELALKLKRFVDHTGGDAEEKDTAAKKLMQLMQTHGITPNMIEENPVADHVFKLTKQDERLFIQIVHHVCPVGVQLWDMRSNKTAHKHISLIVACTASNAIEIQAKFDFYRAALEKEYNIFYKAFVHKNNILANSDGKAKEDYTPEELEEIDRIVNLMKGMKPHEFHKQLSDKNY